MKKQYGGIIVVSIVFLLVFYQIYTLNQKHAENYWRISDLEDTVEKLESKVSDLEYEVYDLRNRVEDMGY
jgi:cell division protein FtsL